MKLLKKTISVLLATAMVVPSILSATAVDNTQTEKKYSAFKTSYINENGERVSNIDYDAESVYKNSRTVLPSSYNSVDYGYVTSVKDQGGTGTCWAHATLSSCESSMIINNGYDTDLDLAEIHLAYAMYHTKADKMGMFDSYMNFDSNKTYLDEGAFASDTLITLANQQGVVKETANHGQFSSEKLGMLNPENFEIYNTEALYAFNEAIVTNGYKIPIVNRDLVKQYIMKYGSGTLDYNSSDKYYNSETSTYYCYDSYAFSDHCVAIVGWDDGFPKENCTVNGYTPKEDGAWLFKNSWGTDQGNDGYMWISYEDKSLVNYPILFYELTSSDTYTNTYQYDDMFKEYFLDDGTGNIMFVGGAYMANVFTAQKDNETLEAVSFYTSNDKLDYTVNVYTGVEGKETPANGTLKATVSGEDLTMGYHTIKLNEPVALEKGEKFSVVVNIKDNQYADRGVYVNIDSVTYRYETKVSDYGESFFSLDGENWDDLKYSIDGNMRIKAFTNSDETPVELEDYYNSYAGKTRDEILSEFKTALGISNAYIFTDFKYSQESLEELINYRLYAEQAYRNSDIFLALEFEAIKNRLEQICNNMEPYSLEDDIIYYYDSIVNNVEYFYTLPQWIEFEDVYNSVLEESKTVELSGSNVPNYIMTVENAFVDFMTYAIDNGFYNSYLQNFGDVNNSGDVNIADATTIQMILAEYDEFDFHKYYNYDVDGDNELTIKDATTVQMYVSRLIEYMPVYDKQFGYGADNELSENIDANTAIANLETAVANIESLPVFDALSYLFRETKYIAIWCQYNDAKEVLENPESYHPNVIDFKARCINWNLLFLDAAG